MSSAEQNPEVRRKLLKGRVRFSLVGVTSTLPAGGASNALQRAAELADHDAAPADKLHGLSTLDGATAAHVGAPLHARSGVEVIGPLTTG